MKNLPEDKSEVVLRTVVGDYELTLVKRETHIEAFTFTNIRGQVLRWNITAAKEAVRLGQVDGKDTIDFMTMALIAKNNEWTGEGVANADPAEPGIAVPIKDGDESFYILIDGIHRCVRALFDQRPFEAWRLSPRVSRACFIDGPEELLP